MNTYNLKNLWSEKKTTIYMILLNTYRLKYYKLEKKYIRQLHTDDIKTMQNRVSSVVA